MAGHDAFEAERQRLQLLAYRLLGSWHDAEDVLQEVALEHLRATGIENAPAWLTSTTVRRSIDVLRRRQRARTYPGPWLPEPLVAAVGEGPAERVEQDETLSYAFLHAAERLSPPQRAVVVLRSLGYAFAEVADVLGLGVATCRQHHARGLRRLAQGRGTTEPQRAEAPTVAAAEVRSLLTAFLRAAREGDAEALERLLHADVVAYNDGGGRTRAALRPVHGGPAVVRFVLGLARRHGAAVRVRPVTVNGAPGVHLVLSGVDHVLAADVRGGRAVALFDVCNPDKLALDRAAGG